MLSKAINIATNAHNGQKDKAGEPYILHPLRVMIHMKDEDSRIVAVLHDVVEDTWVTLSLLQKEGFNQDIIDAIDCLSRRKDEDYLDFIRRCDENNIAKYVKLADLNDNMDLRRIKNPTTQDYERQKKYQKAVDILLGLSE
jgi:(p)ppGpp synthase/HD superfamily hydrolase